MAPSAAAIESGADTIPIIDTRRIWGWMPTCRALLNHSSAASEPVTARLATEIEPDE